MQEAIRTERFRVAFLGRGNLGHKVLSNLVEDTNIDVPVVFTCRGDAEVGADERRFETIAKEREVPFFKTHNINRSEWVEVLAEIKPDLAVAMLWINTIGQDVIRTSRLGFLNCHGGLLPRYRGNACLNWAILNGEKEIGVTVH